MVWICREQFRIVLHAISIHHRPNEPHYTSENRLRADLLKVITTDLDALLLHLNIQWLVGMMRLCRPSVWTLESPSTTTSPQPTICNDVGTGPCGTCNKFASASTNVRFSWQLIQTIPITILPLVNITLACNSSGFVSQHCAHKRSHRVANLLETIGTKTTPQESSVSWAIIRWLWCTGHLGNVSQFLLWIGIYHFCFITVYSWGANVPAERPTSFATNKPKLVASLGIILALRCVTDMFLKRHVSDSASVFLYKYAKSVFSCHEYCLYYPSYRDGRFFFCVMLGN